MLQSMLTRLSMHSSSTKTTDVTENMFSVYIFTFLCGYSFDCLDEFKSCEKSPRNTLPAELQALGFDMEKTQQKKKAEPSLSVKQ